VARPRPVTHLDHDLARRELATGLPSELRRLVEGLERTDAFALDARLWRALGWATGLGWSYGDKPTFVLTRRELPRTRVTVEFYSGDLAQFVNGRLRPTFRTIWFVGGGEVSVRQGSPGKGEVMK
jgi:hypothetical protein